MSDQPIDPVETQAETTPTPEVEKIDGVPFDAARAMATIEKLRAEIKELKPKAKQADELSAAEAKRKEAEMTELQKLQAQLEKTQAELKAAQLSQLKRDVAARVELPLIFADRLQGETVEELEADAKKIMEALPKAPKPPPVSPTSPGAGASQQETLDQQRARVYGSGVNPLDPEYAKAHGGGVFFKEK
jgi:DNA repair exonuclease SbcCD ATPase subunit